MRTLGEGRLPCVAILDGCVSGGALGVGAHAAACVVTERTRLSLPGPTYGFVPEAFAAYQLARLPQPGLGSYLALSGATLTGPELAELGLATHVTESQAVERLTNELRHQRVRHLGRTVRTLEVACIEPREAEYTEAHALYYADSIAECFAEPSVGAILAKLEAGSSLWHAQAAHALRAASPLALALTHTLLREAARDQCWTDVLKLEAQLNAAALAAPDCTKGARSLEAAKRELLQISRELTAAAADDDVDDEEEGVAAAAGGDEQSPSESADAEDAATEAMLVQWGEARQAADYATANRLRAELRGRGTCPEELMQGAAPPGSWEHAGVDEVTEEVVRAYLPA